MSRNFASPNSNNAFLLNEFLIQPNLNQISLEDKSFRVEPKVMATLLCLIEAKGQPITRQDILEKVWPDQIISDEVLTRAIFELRKIFNDDAKKPRFIATIPKRGYRCIAQVALPKAQQAPKLLNRALVIAGALAIAIFLSYAIKSFFYNEKASTDLPLPPSSKLETSMLGLEYSPNVSVNDKLAFSYQASSEKSKNIMVQDPNTHKLTQMTNSIEDDTQPLWSTDGKSLLFNRCNALTCRLIQLDTSTNSETIIYQSSHIIEDFAWSARLEKIVFSERRLGNAGNTSLMVYDLKQKSLTPLVKITSESFYQYRYPVFSPSESKLGFIRRNKEDLNSILIYDFPKQQLDTILVKQKNLDSFTFGKTDNEILISRVVANQSGLWRYTIDKADLNPILISSNSSQLAQPHFNNKEGKLYYQSRNSVRNIYRLTSSKSLPSLIITSSELDRSARLSSDGEKAAFISRRSSNLEVWTQNLTSGNLTKQTNLNFSKVGLPIWSEDNSHIAVRGLMNEQSYILVLNSNKAEVVRKLPVQPDHELLDWSLEQQALYIGKYRLGVYEIHKFDLQSSTWHPLIAKAGWIASLSKDGVNLYYHHYQALQLRRLNLLTKEDFLIASNIDVKDYWNAVFTDKNFFYINENDQLISVDLNSAVKGLSSIQLPSGSNISDVSSNQSIIFDAPTIEQSEIRSMRLD